MPDLNNMMEEVQRNSTVIKDKMKDLFMQYDGLLRESNRIFLEERMKSGSTAGLEDFIRLMQIIKRNRDVIGSMMRGVSNIRAFTGFKFIEEDIAERPVKTKRAPKKAPVEVPQIPEIPAEIMEPTNA
jgi:hypothetical protein